MLFPLVVGAQRCELSAVVAWIINITLGILLVRFFRLRYRLQLFVFAV
jgi:hypothetical protein